MINKGLSFLVKSRLTTGFVAMEQNSDTRAERGTTSLVPTATRCIVCEAYPALLERMMLTAYAYIIAQTPLDLMGH